MLTSMLRVSRHPALLGRASNLRPTIQSIRLNLNKAEPSEELKRKLNTPVHSRGNRPESPKFRYLLYVFFFSTGLLVLATRKVDKRSSPKQSFTEREFKDYERTSGIKRRHKLVTDSSKYEFYAVPYANSSASLDPVLALLPRDKEVKVIDTQALIEQEIADDERRYSYLLQDLRASKKPLPKGLVTALIKQEIKFFLNTTKGTYDTAFVIKNYPQDTYEASKFENEIADITKVVVTLEIKADTGKTPEQVRLVNNVIGYFDTVDKVVEVQL